MSLTIDDGSMIYYFKSNSRIKRVRIEGADTQISYHAAESQFDPSILRSITTTDSIVSADLHQPIKNQPVICSIEDIPCSPESRYSHQNLPKSPNPVEIQVSLRRASIDLMKVMRVKLGAATRYSGRKVAKAFRQIKAYRS